jgi:L-ribulose-5-phosphate 3-epimerase
MNFGVLSVAFGECTYQELAQRIQRNQFDATHLELTLINNVDHRLGKLSTGLANVIAEEFERAGVRIPVLGCYVNLIDVNLERRKEYIGQLKEHLKYARDFGASAVTTETGTANRNSPWEHHPDNQNEANWKLLKSVVEEVVEVAEKFGVSLGLEGYYNNVINTPERMQRMLEEVPSMNLGIVMDPCNYIHAGLAERQQEVMAEAFTRLGKHILIAHAKDIIFKSADTSEEHREIQPAAGTGILDYATYMKLLHQYKPQIKIFLEHLKEEQMSTSIAYVREAYELAQR